jgi:hypothetical protein
MRKKSCGPRTRKEDEGRRENDDKQQKIWGKLLCSGRGGHNKEKAANPMAEIGGKAKGFHT